MAHLSAGRAEWSGNLLPAAGPVTYTNV